MGLKIKAPRWGSHGPLHSQAWKKGPKGHVEGGGHQRPGEGARAAEDAEEAWLNRRKIHVGFLTEVNTRSEKALTGHRARKFH